MSESRVAYVSMEIALESGIPTYSGGLGVLAGDTVRAAADLGLPLVAISLVHRHGYFRQRLDPDEGQQESLDPWSAEGRLDELPTRFSVMVSGRPVSLRAFRYVARGVSGAEVPVYLLDACVPSNTPEQQALTDRLYGGDDRYRLSQEAVLGLGAVALLEALGLDGIRAYHMNEGHAALLALALLEREEGPEDDAIQAVRQRCVFTTHTPIPAGHDRFSLELAGEVLGAGRLERLARAGCCPNGTLNLTYVALVFSRYVNGVAMRHGQISRDMFPGYPIASITNGVHAATWTGTAFRDLYDRLIPNWRRQNLDLRHALSVPLDEIQIAHRRSKRELLAEVEKRTGVRLGEETLTLGFARRATPYKRADLLVSDVERLRRIKAVGPLQIVYAGKAHPRDGGGKEMIRRVLEAAARLRGVADVVYLENHDTDLGRLLCAGVDVWVNTPRKPQEASGTSGMKAALNGVPSLSVLDGWWIEGHVEGVTGWCVGETFEPESDGALEAQLLYAKLEEIVALFYQRPDAFARVMRYAIAINGAFFNAQRMIEQYARSAYRLGA